VPLANLGLQPDGRQQIDERRRINGARSVGEGSSGVVEEEINDGSDVVVPERREDVVPETVLLMHLLRHLELGRSTAQSVSMSSLQIFSFANSRRALSTGLDS
jgi:hypothetical protein